MDQQRGVKRRRSLRASRRRAIKGTATIAATGILLNKWQSPVVDSIMLPAHAQTTDATGSGSPQVPQTRNYWGSNISTAPFNQLESPAATVCVEETNSMATVVFQGESNTGRRSATVSTNGTPSTTTTVSSSPNNCPIPDDLQVSVTAISDASISIAVRNTAENYGYDMTILAGTCGSFPATDRVCKKKATKKKAEARRRSHRAKRYMVS